MSGQQGYRSKKSLIYMYTCCVEIQILVWKYWYHELGSYDIVTSFFLCTNAFEQANCLVRWLNFITFNPIPFFPFGYASRRCRGCYCWAAKHPVISAPSVHELKTAPSSKPTTKSNNLSPRAHDLIHHLFS